MHRVVTIQLHILEGWFGKRDLGAVLDHEEPLPHRWKIASSSYWLLLARGPRFLVVPASHTAAGIAPTIPKLRI
jgi:hypothetical protein